MKTKQILLLSIALLLPVMLFVFLKSCGKNEFAVPPLFTDAGSASLDLCDNKITLPYRISGEELQSMDISIDSLACISFPSAKSVDRVKEAYENSPVSFYSIEGPSEPEKFACTFLMQEPFDVALVDSRGQIRGQYDTSERDEVDRLITEIAIILKKY